MRIALVGSAPSSVSRAPYRDEKFKEFTGARTLSFPPPPFIDQSWQIWGCSPGAFGIVERANVWFELHRWEPGKPWFSPEYCTWLKNFKGPVYTGQKIPEIPGSIEYPLQHVVDEFTPYFLTSSLSLMCALAIGMVEADRAMRDASISNDTDAIGFWGVDMAASEEYGYQRAGCQFFMVEAYRRGIRVILPPESCLARALPIYGISEWDHNQIKILARRNELAQQEAYFNAQVAQSTANLHFIKGALEDLDYMGKTWTESSQVAGEASVVQLVSDIGEITPAPKIGVAPKVRNIKFDPATGAVIDMIEEAKKEIVSVSDISSMLRPGSAADAVSKTPSTLTGEDIAVGERVFAGDGLSNEASNEAAYTPLPIAAMTANEILAARAQPIGFDPGFDVRALQALRHGETDLPPMRSSQVDRGADSIKKSTFDAAAILRAGDLDRFNDGPGEVVGDTNIGVAAAALAPGIIHFSSDDEGPKP